LSAPTIQLQDDCALPIARWPKLPRQQAAEPGVMGGDAQLPLIFRSTKQIDQAKQVYVIKALQWII
jgi:hypothetical protein